MTGSLRKTFLDRQAAAGLSVGDVVFGLLPDGKQVLLWGAELLAAIIETGQTQDCVVITVRIGSMDEAKALADRYWLACDDQEGEA